MSFFTPNLELFSEHPTFQGFVGWFLLMSCLLSNDLFQRLSIRFINGTTDYGVDLFLHGNLIARNLVAGGASMVVCGSIDTEEYPFRLHRSGGYSSSGSLCTAQLPDFVKLYESNK